jgi:hypothetical protein
MAHWHTTPLAIAIVCVLFLFPVIAAQTKVGSCSYEGSPAGWVVVGSCKSCVNRYEDRSSRSQCGWCGSTETDGYCLAEDSTLSSKEKKCGTLHPKLTKGTTTDVCDPDSEANYRAIYIPIIVFYSLVNAAIMHKSAGELRVSPKIKCCMIIFGLLLPIVSIIIIRKNRHEIRPCIWDCFQNLGLCSAAPEQPPPETELHAIEPVSSSLQQPPPETQVHAIEPVFGAEPQALDPSSLQQPYKSSPEPEEMKAE